MARLIAQVPLFVLMLFVVSGGPVEAADLAAKSARPSPASFDSSVHRLARADIERVAGQIDLLVNEKLIENGIKANGTASDEIFLRRVFLQIAGRIPTMNEARSFLQDRNPDKRARLIDQLLDSDAYVSHQFHFWADLLRVKQRLMGGVPGKPYVDFIKSSIASNMPYDEFVRALLTSEGPALKRDNGATGYYMRDMGMPEDNMSNTVRVFLGTRLECAQCHDHPFDSWTQKDYFQMVAFTGGVRTRLEGAESEKAREIRRAINDKSLSAEQRRRVRRVVQPLNFGVQGGGTGLARLPEDYQYDDGSPHEIVTAKAIFDSPVMSIDPEKPIEKGRKKRGKKRRQQQIRGAADIDSREAYAQWLTSSENPRFAKVIANRLWKYALGMGLIEPVDDMTDDTIASNPELMKYLSEQMVALDFDVKQFLRAIYLTKTFQRASVSSDIDSTKPFLFSGPLMKRMSAEQLWDSLVTLTVSNVDVRENLIRPKGLYNGRLADGDVYDAYESLHAMPLKELVEMAANGRKPMMENTMSKGEAAMRASRKKVTEKQRDLKKRMQKARRDKDFRKVRRLQSELTALIGEAREAFAFRDFVRASELSSPMRPGHFLREFGQSDREQIDNSNDEAAVTQVLSLMNGVLEKRIVNNPYSILMKNVSEVQTPRDRLDAVFLTILGRFPKPFEQREWGQHLANGGQGRDVIWVLANTHEFMFVQ